MRRRILAGLFSLMAGASCGDDGAGGAGGSTAHDGGGSTNVTTTASGGSASGGGASGGGGAGNETGGNGAGGSVGGTGQGGSGQGGTGQGGIGQGGDACGGPDGVVGSGACEFPQGVPDEEFVDSACDYSDTDPVVDAAVNAVMASLTGCSISSDCPITGFGGVTVDEICQSWFVAVTAELRAQGYCAGQHAVGSTDEIAVSNTGCSGKWYGYHVCNYGGPKVVWNPGARRGWWAINPDYCP